MTFSPPPWADIGRLLLYGCYFYIAFFFLAVLISYSYSIPNYLQRRFEGVFSGVNEMLDSSGMDKVFFSRSFTFGVLRMFVSTIICIIYVYSTYAGHINLALLAFQKFVAIVLLLNVVYKVLFATRPISYILGFETTMDVFSLASLLLAKQTDWLNFSFLQAYVILSRYFQIEPTLEIFFMVKSSPFHRQLTRLALEFVVFIYVFASGLQLFEQLGEPWETLIGTTFDLTLANSFYFTVVTIFTVGYGDFVPFTLLGRLWIIFIIVFGAYLVSRKIGQVVDVVSGLRRGLGSFVKTEGTDHCVICGNVKWEYLKAFVLEFYGDDRNTKTKLVIICDQPNWSETVWNNFFTSNIQFRDHVTYLEGSCVSRDDLIRAQVETSKAVFILCNQHNPDPYAEDSETLKRILTIRSYTPNLPIYSMCALRDSMLQITFALEQVDEQEEGEEGLSRRTSGMNLRSQMDPSTSDIIGVSALVDELGPNLGDFEDEDDDDDGLLVTSYDGSSDLKSEAICMQEIEMSLLAKNVFCNGLSTLLANLILRVNPILKDEDPMWAWEYKLGTECRFEYVKLPMQLTNRKFSEIALTMYDYGVIPIATKRFMEKKWRAVTPDTIIHLNSIALIITFHSTNYLDNVMSEIASRITESFSDTVSMSSLQDVPPFDDQQHRARRAGDILVGDLTVEYHYVDDSEGEIHGDHLARERFPSHSGEIASGNQDEDPSEITPRQQAGPFASSAAGPSGIIPSGAPSSGLPSSGTENQGGYAEVKSIGDGVSAGISAIAPGRGAPGSGSIPAQMRSQDRLPLVITRTGSTQHLATLSNTPPPVTSEDQGMLKDPTIPSQEVGSQKDREAALASILSEAKILRRPVVEQLGDIREPSQVEDRSGTSPNTEGGPSTDTRFTAAQAGSSSDGKGLGIRHEPQQVIDEGTLARRPAARHVSFQNQASSAERKAKKSMSKARPRRTEHAHQGAVIMVHGDQQLPMKLSGHIVVCTIGRMALQNLGYFLHQVNVERSFSKGKAPVVAICSRLTEEEEADLEVYASNGHTRDVRTKKQSSTAVTESGRHQPSLVVIQGNSLSVRTLRRAQFEKAKAVVILACEDVNDIDHMDAKAIFTVMTLDHLLGEDSETFVCTMLDAEESMQLLRAPRHPRRRGALLGRLPEENMEFAVTSPRADGSRRRITSKSRFARFPGQYRDIRDSPQRFPSRTLSYGAITTTGRVPRSVSFIGDRHLNGDFMYPSQNTFGGREGSSSSFGAFQRLRDGEDGALMQNPSLAGDSAFRILLGPSANNGEGGETLRDETGKLRAMNGLRHGFRDESFEKQRYASGEMMISSTYMSLLIREFAMPGLIAVVRKIFGATIGKNTKPKRSWIRAVSIPEKWIREKEERTYREVFEVLIGYGAIALGLYRSGNVNVRVQFMSGPEGSSTAYSSRTPSLGSSRESSSDNMARNAGGSFDDPVVSMPEFGGRVPSQLEQAENEQSSLLHTRSAGRDLRGYGALGTSHGYLGGYEFGQSDGGESDTLDTADGGRIPAELFRVAESVVSGRAPSSYDEWGNEYRQEVHREYTCPSSRRTTMYKELPGGDNVLPYVYTNPEAFTLVSNNDAVYVLVSPNVQLPDEW